MYACAATALVGQDGILRPIGNRPVRPERKVPAGGLPTRRRMPSCPIPVERFPFLGRRSTLIGTAEVRLCRVDPLKLCDQMAMG
jgi:hypothetical protein